MLTRYLATGLFQRGYYIAAIAFQAFLFIKRLFPVVLGFERSGVINWSAGITRRQIEFQPAADSDNDGPFNDILLLAHVAGPSVGLQLLYIGLRESGLFTVVTLAQQGYKMRGE